jgi:hypothetical protein
MSPKEAVMNPGDRTKLLMATAILLADVLSEISPAQLGPASCGGGGFLWGGGDDP